MKQQQNIHAGRIILILLVGLWLEDKYPFVAILMALTAVVITFKGINKTIKQENKWNN